MATSTFNDVQLFVVGFPPSMPQTQIKDLLAACGTVKDLSLKTLTYGRLKVTTALITMKTMDEALRVFSSFHGKLWERLERGPGLVEEYRTRVEFSKEWKHAKMNNVRVVVNNLPADYTEYQATQLLEKYGKTDRVQTRYTHGHVNGSIIAKSLEDAVAMIDGLNGATIGENKVRAEFEHDWLEDVDITGCGWEFLVKPTVDGLADLPPAGTAAAGEGTDTAGGEHQQQPGQLTPQYSEGSMAATVAQRPEPFLYIINLPVEITEEGIRQLLSPFGDIVSVHLAVSKVHSAAHCFTSLPTVAEGARAISALNNRDIVLDDKPPRRITVEWSKMWIKQSFMLELGHRLQQVRTQALALGLQPKDEKLEADRDFRESSAASNFAGSGSGSKYSSSVISIASTSSASARDRPVSVSTAPASYSPQSSSQSSSADRRYVSSSSSSSSSSASRRDLPTSSKSSPPLRVSTGHMASMDRGHRDQHVSKIFSIGWPAFMDEGALKQSFERYGIVYNIRVRTVRGVLAAFVDMALEDGWVAIDKLHDKEVIDDRTGHLLNKLTVEYDQDWLASLRARLEGQKSRHAGQKGHGVYATGFPASMPDELCVLFLDRYGEVINYRTHEEEDHKSIWVELSHDHAARSAVEALNRIDLHTRKGTPSEHVYRIKAQEFDYPLDPKPAAGERGRSRSPPIVAIRAPGAGNSTMTGSILRSSRRDRSPPPRDASPRASSRHKMPRYR